MCNLSYEKVFRSIVLKSLSYHHEIVDITPKLNKGPGTRTVLTTYGLNLKNTGICSCAKNKTKKRSFRECALDRDTFDQRGHMCSDTQRDPTKNNDDRNFKKSHYCPFNMKTFTIQKIRPFLRINIYYIIR